MKNQFLSRLTLYSILLVFGFLVSCNKEDGLGIGVLPDDDLVNIEYLDSFTVNVHCIEQAPLVSDGKGVGLMGKLIDPEFGGLEAATYMQFNTLENDIILGEDDSLLKLDSLVLQLAITGYYGRNSDQLEVKIHEIIDDAFDEDSVYYTTSSVNVNKNLELSKGYKLSYDGKDFAAVNLITITLDSSLGNKLLHAGGANLSTNIAFTRFFHGLSIGVTELSHDPNREPGGIYKLDVAGGYCALSLFYHKDTIASKYDFVANANSAHFFCLNRFGSESSLFGTEFNNPQSEYSFIQGGTPIRSIVSFPHLDSLDALGINRAELVFNVPSGIGASLDVLTPPTIEAYLADTTGISYPDGSSPTNTSTYDATAGTLTITLTNTLIQTLNGSIENNGLILQAANESTTTQRLLLYNQNNESLKPRLKIVYTSFPEP